MLVLTALCVLGLNVYAALLVVLRARVWKVRLYRPMLLNIGLSLAPLVVAVALVVGLLLTVVGITRSSLAAAGPAVLWIFLVVAGGVWVLLFPNAEYLITELNLSHRETESPVPLWFDIVQTLTLTLSGITNALASLAIVQLFAVVLFADPVKESTLPPGSWVVAGVVLVLGGFGVYLGRYLRLNSVDARHPLRLLGKVRRYFDTRRRILDVVGFVATHTLLLAIVYVPLFAGIYGLVTA